jgi:hypothetical protein
VIYELRTYQLQPGTLAEVERRFARTYRYRRVHSPLAAFWHTVAGPLDEIVHLWPYADLAERALLRAAAFADPRWPPAIRQFITHMRAEILVPVPGTRVPDPGRVGPFFELRRYQHRPGTLNPLMQRWRPDAGTGGTRSRLVLAGATELGDVTTFVHIRAHRSLDRGLDRGAGDRGGWLPPGGTRTLIARSSTLLMPAAFSPLQ